MPDATQTVLRFPLDSSRGNDSSLGSDIVPTLSTPHQWFVSSSPYTPPDTVAAMPFPSTLTTRAFDPCSLRRFGARSCKPAPRGLPSSPVQLRGAQSSSYRPDCRLPTPEDRCTPSESSSPRTNAPAFVYGAVPSAHCLLPTASSLTGPPAYRSIYHNP